MPTLITGSELRAAVEKQTFIKNGRAGNAEDIKYDFRLSGKILKASYGRPIDAGAMSLIDLTELVIEPGEVVFALSEERLELPLDMIAQLSPKRKMSQSGVLTLGGLTVDPGYNGWLLLGLLNFSSTPFVLKPGRKIIAATFYRLTADERKDLRGTVERLDDFPDDLVDIIQKYKPVDSKFVTDALERLQSDIKKIWEDLKTRDEWKERLDRHDSQIGQLLKGLADEKDTRERGEDKISKAIEDLNKTFYLIKGGAIIFWIVIAVVVIPFVVQWLPKLLGFFSAN